MKFSTLEKYASNHHLMVGLVGHVRSSQKYVNIIFRWGWVREAVKGQKFSPLRRGLFKLRSVIKSIAYEDISKFKKDYRTQKRDLHIS